MKCCSSLELSRSRTGTVTKKHTTMEQSTFDRPRMTVRPHGGFLSQFCSHDFWLLEFFLGVFQLRPGSLANVLHESEVRPSSRTSQSRLRGGRQSLRAERASMRMWAEPQRNISAFVKKMRNSKNSVCSVIPVLDFMLLDFVSYRVPPREDVWGSRLFNISALIYSQASR